jgi:S-adenosyl methyltransferase
MMYQGAFQDKEIPPSANLELDRPHPARMYDYYLGGKDNYPADREAAEAALEAFPGRDTAPRQNRAFLVRAVRYLAQEAGIRQFVDVGTGIPTSPNLHEAAQAVAPESRIVYVDNDPIVLVHARALLTSSREGRTSYIDADLRNPESILTAPQLHRTLDLSRPVALTLIAIMHFIHDADDPCGIIRRLMDALPSGSYLALSQATGDFTPDGLGKVTEAYQRARIPIRIRSRAEIERFFDGLELVEPGLQLVNHWRLGPGEAHLARLPDHEVSVYGAVARKP